jgi:hypothetical protein
MFALGAQRFLNSRLLSRHGELNVLDAGYYEGTPPEHVDELHAILESMTFSQTTHVERRIDGPSCKAGAVGLAPRIERAACCDTHTNMRCRAVAPGPCHRVPTVATFGAGRASILSSPQRGEIDDQINRE